MNVITLTLNPALDIHCYAENLTISKENQFKIDCISSGGKGINISNALLNNGVKSTALMLLGSENGRDFLKGLDKNLRKKVFFVNGRVRENLTLYTENKDETRISFKGDEIDGAVFSRVKKFILKNKKDLILTFTGSLPKGISKEEVVKFLISLRDEGVKVVIDSKSLSLGDIKEIKPWLIKPNGEEIAEYYDGDIFSLEDALLAAEEIFGYGIENVMISLGSMGAVLVNSQGKFSSKAPKINPLSTVGAGDSMIAGFIKGYIEGLSSKETLDLAVRFGSAACLTKGTAPPKI